MANNGTLETIVTALGRLIEPLATGLDRDNVQAFFGELGYPLNDAQADSLSGGTTGVSATLGGLLTAVAELVAAAESDADNVLEKGLQASARLIEALDAFIEIRDAIDGLGLGVSSGEISELPERLLSYLLVKNFESIGPVNEILEFLNVLERVEHNVDSVDPDAPEYTVSSFHFGRLLDWLDDPGHQFETLYGWGTAGFDGSALFPRLENLVATTGMPVIYDSTANRLDLVLLEVTAPDTLNPRGLNIALANQFNSGELTLPNGDFEVSVELGLNAPTGLAITLQPDGRVELIPPDTSAQLSGEVRLGFLTTRGPYILLGEADGSRLEIKGIGLDTGVRLQWNGSSGKASGDFEIGGRLEEGKVVIDASKGDGFLNSIIPGGGIQGDFDLALGYATDTGFFIQGSSAIEIKLPLHADLGPIGFDALTIGAGFGDGAISTSLGADLSASLGPLQAVVENMGVEAEFTFPSGGGNLGPLNLDLGFKPPNGIGLSLDVGVVKGGGYLYFNFDKEEYAGALEFVFSEIVTVKAVGLLTTRMPDGSKGFSLLIILSVEFGTPFQLGFGFTLNAVGGLLGLNRTMELERIAVGVRTGAINSVMFPQDLVANAPRIISDLREFFPPQSGTFLIGPMAKLGWGTPTLVTASLGIIIEIPPGNIAILGILKVALPDEDFALIVVQVNFIGALEVDKKRLWFYASLYESRVLFITLEGDMGLLIAWGDDANFVLSIGGFHPSFNPPPLPFPNPKRIAISILNESWAKIRVSGYFAVTSNTAQFGARVEVFFGVSAFNLDGHIGFDALFQFSPFYFIISISASLSVKVFGAGLFSVHIKGQLEGTSPWHIEGKGKIKVLFFSIKIPFSHTWGEKKVTTLPAIEALPLLVAELEKFDNWTAESPGASSLLVSLREIDSDADLVLHPVGKLRVHQRVMPLNLNLDKIGNQQPSDAKRFTVEVVDGDIDKVADTRESFATAQFRNLNDAKRLSSPAYEKQDAGIELSVTGNQSRTHSAVKRVVRYEEIIIDNRFLPPIRRFVGIVGSLFAHWVFGNAASRSPLSAKNRQYKAPVDIKVVVTGAQYAVANTMDNTLFADDATFGSQAAAEDYLQTQLANGSSLDDLHVIPQAELKNAA
jgi:hypothetical protein